MEMFLNLENQVQNEESKGEKSGSLTDVEDFDQVHH